MSKTELTDSFELSSKMKKKVLSEVNRFMDGNTWYEISMFYQEDDEPKRYSDMVKFYLKHYVREYEEKIVRMVLQLCTTYDCLVEDPFLSEDKIDPNVENYTYVHIDNMDLEYLAELVRKSNDDKDFCLFRIYFWELDSVIEVFGVDSFTIYSQSREFINKVEYLAQTEGLYLREEFFGVKDMVYSRKLTNLINSGEVGFDKRLEDFYNDLKHDNSQKRFKEFMVELEKYEESKKSKE